MGNRLSRFSVCLIVLFLASCGANYNIGVQNSDGSAKAGLSSDGEGISSFFARDFCGGEYRGTVEVPLSLGK